jgi:hypothetical protein
MRILDIERVLLTSIETSNSIFGAEAGMGSTAFSSSFFGYRAGAVAAGVRELFLRISGGRINN